MQIPLGIDTRCFQQQQSFFSLMAGPSNAPPWDFGKLLGLYVVFFFIIAQLISWIFFKQAPSLMVMAGRALIVPGRIVISFAKFQGR
jgi:hypothetical protein